MKFTVHGKQLVVTEALREYAETKIGRVEKYNEGLIGLAVTLSADKLKTGNYHTAEVLAYLEGSTIKASFTDSDLYAAIDQVTDKLEAQLKKHKEKIKDALHSREPLVRGLKFNAETNEVAKEKTAKVVKVFVTPKPMTVEEAILQLEILNKVFLTFRNVETGDMNVIYKRKDGDYGLIEG